MATREPGQQSEAACGSRNLLNLLDQRFTNINNLHQDDINQIESKASETRRANLEKLRLNQRRRLINELPESRERRLKQLREYQQRRRANETLDEREMRLLKLRQNQRRRRANETPEEREKRLLQLRINQQKRRAKINAGIPIKRRPHTKYHKEIEQSIQQQPDQYVNFEVIYHSILDPDDILHPTYRST